ncbi:MAG: hypothetical protein H6728_12620 [Myxococcales bacterium]|nr:hypothetical protein [Myxococcales bacterium]
MARMVEDIERFRQGLSSEKSEVRYASVRGLRVLGHQAREVAGELLRVALEDPSLRVQVEAAEAFSLVGPDVKAFEETLVGALLSPQYELLVNASFVLHSLGRQAQPLRDSLVRSLQQVYEMPLYFLLGCLATLEPLEENARIIRDLIEERGRYLLFFFVESLCKMGPRVHAILREGMQSEGTTTRMVCAAALWSQTQDAEAMGILEQTQRDGDTPEIICAASALLIRLGHVEKGQAGLFSQLPHVREGGLFALMLGTLCNVAHEAPQGTLQVLRTLLYERDPERLEQIIGAVGRTGRLGSELCADLAFFFRQAWELWVARRAPVSFRLLLRNRCPAWLPSSGQQPQPALRQIDPQLFPDTLSDNERRLALHRWAEPLLFRLIDTIDSSGQLDPLRLREPMGYVLIAEDVSWSLRHAAAEAIGRQPREEELSRMLRAAVRSSDTELAHGVLMGLERNLEIALIFAGLAQGGGVSSLSPPESSEGAASWTLAWHQSAAFLDACRQPERLSLLGEFLKHAEYEIRLLAGRILLLLGHTQPMRSLFRALLSDRKMLFLWSDALRRMFRWLGDGAPTWLQEDVEALCTPILQMNLPLLQSLSGALLTMAGHPLKPEDMDVLESACTEDEAANWLAWIKAQQHSLASIQAVFVKEETFSKASSLVEILCSKVWEDPWKERFLLRLATHLIGMHLERFGPWPGLVLEDIVATRESWRKGQRASHEMQQLYAEVTGVFWDTLLLRNQQEHFSTPRINSIYQLMQFLQLILRPRAVQEPNTIFQALVAAQELQVSHALGDGLHPESIAQQLEREARVACCSWMGEQLRTLFAELQQTQEHVQQWREKDQELLFSED